MKVIRIGKGTTIVDNKNEKLVESLRKTYWLCTKNGYIWCKDKKTKKLTTLHRIILNLGEYTRISCVDHINGVRNDNRIKNLRVVTMAENSQHKTITKNGKYRNIYRHSKTKKKGLRQYIVQLQFNRKRYYGGQFYSMDSAISAAVALRKKVFGKLA